MSDSREIQSNVRFLPDSGRRAYETEAVATIISLFARPGMPRPGMPDADRDSEGEAQQIFYASLEHFIGDLERAAAKSPLYASRLHDLRDVILDNVPGRLSWDEAINSARRGWEVSGIK